MNEVVLELFIECSLLILYIILSWVIATIIAAYDARKKRKKRNASGNNTQVLSVKDIARSLEFSDN